MAEKMGDFFIKKIFVLSSLADTKDHIFVISWCHMKALICGGCLAKVKNDIFLGEMHRHMSHEEEQKFFFAAARLFWPEGCLRDFFGLKKAEGLLKAKRSLAKAKQVFLFFQMMKNVVH